MHRNPVRQVKNPDDDGFEIIAENALDSSFDTHPIKQSAWRLQDR